METPARLTKFLVLSALLLVTTACSDDRSPPDDDGASSEKLACTALAPDAYRTCATSALEGSPLTPAEVEALTRSCDEARRAGAQGSADGVFAAARATIQLSCP